jgi:hypothetical protein
MQCRSSIRVFCILLCLAGFLSSASAQSTLYVYGDNSCPGAGTDADPYCSIQNAFDNVAAGDTIRIRDASSPYDEHAVATTTGTEGNIITLEPDIGHNPTIRYTDTGNSNTGAIEIRNASYWTVQNLTFDGAGVEVSRSALRFWAYNNNITDVKAIGNTIQNWGNSVSQSLNKEPLAFMATSGLRIHNGLVQGNTIRSSRGRNIYIQRNLNTIVEDNEISDFRCADASPFPYRIVGIKVEGGTEVINNSGVIIRNNHIHDPSSSSTCPGVSESNMHYRGIFCDVDTRDVEVYGNIIHDFPLITGSAIYVEHHCYRWTVKNNVIWNMPWDGIRVRGNDGTQILNNTLYNIAESGGDGSGIVVHDGANATIKNNIVQADRWHVEIGPLAVADGGHVIDYNLYDNTGGAPVFNWNGGSTENFTAWKTNCNNCDNNSSVEDPKFVNPTAGNLCLQADSPALNAGEGSVTIGATPNNCETDTATEPVASQPQPPENFRTENN